MATTGQLLRLEVLEAKKKQLKVVKLEVKLAELVIRAAKLIDDCWFNSRLADYMMRDVEGKNYDCLVDKVRNYADSIDVGDEEERELLQVFRKMLRVLKKLNVLLGFEELKVPYTNIAETENSIESPSHTKTIIEVKATLDGDSLRKNLLSPDSEFLKTSD